ncbi:MAG: 3-phosphoshikimate 1-carboxyvinyltransferase [Clostridia bacterium]|nr:3-phosphoshikimate 1-carboxyvinyltransferase [Clostridia bacterium]
MKEILASPRCCAKIRPQAARGNMTAPPSKSVSHRMLICAALAEGTSTLSGLSFSEDILATIDTMSALGARFERVGAVLGDGVTPDPHGGETVRVYGCGGRLTAPDQPTLAPLFCRESGSTLRFLVPLCLLSPSARMLQGSTRLFSRPLTVYEHLFSERWGEREVREDDPPRGGTLQLRRGNTLGGGEYQLSGDISSQFITGLLFALPLCEQDSRIVLTSRLESRPYIDLTIDALRSFGVRVDWESESILCIPGKQSYHPYDGRVEGDASNAAFFGALNFFGGEVVLNGLKPDSLQGDRVFDALFREIGAPRGERDSALPRIDLADCPDLAPILFAVAAEHGGAIFTHTDRLRIKECDRIAAMQEELAKFGAVIEAEDGREGSPGATCGGMVRVLPTKLHPPISPLNGPNDHRVVMSLCVLATKYGGEVQGAGAVRKSMPSFFDVLMSLGADVTLEVE